MNGNTRAITTASGSRYLSYDYRNMLAMEIAEDETLTLHEYDAFGRRVRKIVDADGENPVETRYILLIRRQ